MELEKVSTDINRIKKITCSSSAPGNSLSQ